MSDPLEPLRLAGMRGMIAGRMQASLRDTAQLSFFTDVDASALMSARAAWSEHGIKAGYEDLIISVLPTLAAEFPLLNAREDEAGVITPSPAVHVCVAVSLPTGLVAPAVTDVQDKALPQITAARRDLIARAAAGKLAVAEMRIGTITISNLGTTRVDHFTPILNRPQTAILGIGRIRQAAAVNDEGALMVRPIMGLSLTVDHRVIDGMPAGMILSRIAERLENSPVKPE